MEEEVVINIVSVGGGLQDRECNLPEGKEWTLLKSYLSSSKTHLEGEVINAEIV